MSVLIADYLKAPEERRVATLVAMKRQPDAACKAIMNFRGPYPKGAPVIDVIPDYLAPLLTELFKSCPRIIIDRDPKRMKDGERWFLTEAAIRTDDARFTDVVLSALTDRSALLKLLVIGAIPERAFLQSEAAVPELERSLKLKSLGHWKPEIRAALKAIKKRSTERQAT